MPHTLTSQQVVLLLGTGLAIAAGFVLILYSLHKSLRRQRAQEEFRRAPTKMDDSLFLIASMQGVVTKMKQREKELESLLREAEQRAETSTRLLEGLVREIPAGLIVLDQEGFLSQANSLARQILEVDTWSRRRYREILAAGSVLVALLDDCLQKGRACRRQRLIYTAPSGRSQHLEITASPFPGRGGQTAGAICLLTAIPEDKPASS